MDVDHESAAARFFAGKKVVLTGGSSGLGRQLALSLADHGCDVIVAARTEFPDAPAARAGTVTSLRVDLSSLAEVDALAREVERTFSKVDILINNAGALRLEGGLTGDGVEYHLAVNYLAHYRLTNDLLDLLGQGTAPLVVNVGSAGAKVISGCGREDFLAAAKSARIAYERSKWALSAFSFALGDAFAAGRSGLRPVLVQPPLMDTGIIRRNASDRLRTRFVLKLLEMSGAFTNVAAVGDSALEMLVAAHSSGDDYATWSARTKGFAWTPRPQRLSNPAEAERLLEASDDVMRETTGSGASKLAKLLRL